MSFRRVGWIAAIAVATLLSISCGQVYRPVVIPIATNPPNPQNFHAVFGISSNVSSNPGSVLQIDVSGDTNIGVANMGINPTHAAALPDNFRVFVASAGSVIPGNPDTITSFSPAASSTVATGIGSLTVFSLPNVGPNQSSAITAISEAPNTNVVTVTLSQAISLAAVGGQIVISGVNIGAYNGNFAITSVSGNTIQYNNPTTGLLATSGGTVTIPLPTFCSYLPDFVTTTQNTAVYVANYGAEGGATCAYASTDSVALLNPSTGTVENIAYLSSYSGAGSPAPHPVAMAETPNAQNLYVVNQGDGTTPSTVMNLSPTDLSLLAKITVGINPTWVVARLDNQRVYVLTQGDGLLVPIDVATNTVLPSQTNLSVGAGANFLLYDSNLNRLYITNPVTGNVFVYSATGGVDLSGNPNDTPKLLATISMGARACPGGCSPVSVTALPDGSRFYVASYRSETACTDPNVGPTACIVPMLTVFDAPSMTVKTGGSPLLKGSPSLSLLSSPPFSATQFAVPPVASCAPATIYTPSTTRFRMFTTSSSDSSHVYVSMCDAGAVAVVATTTNSINQGTNAPDTLVNNISTPFGACSGVDCSFAASITSFSITSNVVTFQTTTNTFIPGQQVQISGLGIGTYLNGQTLTVLQSGLSATQFSANFTHADVTSTTDSGAAIGLQPAPITSLSINSNVVTFQGINKFTPGTRVAISGLSSAPGSPLNGQTLTVIATGLSNKQFECVLNAAEGNAGSTADSGVAVPLVPPQTPIFLVTGQ